MPTNPPAAAEAKLLAAKVVLPESVLSKTVKASAMYCPEKRIGTGRPQVAGVFMQEGARQKLGSVSGSMIRQSVSVVSAECASTIFPILRIFARSIEHSQPRPKSWQDESWWTKGFMGVYEKFIVQCKRSSGQPGRQDWELIQVQEDGGF